MAEPKPPYRAEHVGSLPRPDELMAARDRHGAGQLGADDLRQLEDRFIRDAVALQ